MQTKTRDRLLTAFALTLLLTQVAFAQGAGDILGAQQISLTVLLTLKVIAVCGIAFGFVRMMGGHRIEGLLTMAIGAAGVAKTGAIAAWIGLA